jgi:uncharacterized protein HemX
MADSHSGGSKETEATPVTETITEPTPAEAPPAQPKKSVNPIFALILVLILLAGVYYFYSKGTEDKIIRLPMKKGAGAPHHP